ncbi:hypothetical protein L2Y96_10055 [Luteibacter aegosomaticola]|uniref:Ig-like domain-containing protein n=1 Tax=Luteibacter aegosomaticola TaxID=2911538 RepID=UPI001FFAF822|nr:hypothetical protein [Luteibacter aegosomaticola]UPG92084.1 hypothetical protein L2Y96_10055 [Luteibacter aegosomaticola]
MTTQHRSPIAHLPARHLPAPPASAHAFARPQATLGSTKINGQDVGLLGFNDLLDTPNRRVIVTCASSIIVPPANIELCWGVDGTGQPRIIASEPLIDETEWLSFDLPGAMIAGMENPVDGSFAGEGIHDVFVRINYGSSKDDSPHTTATVKCRPPGGLDPINDGRDRNENLPRATVFPATIPDDDGIDVTVTVNDYEVRFDGDVLIVSWGGVYLPAVPSGPGGPITVRVPRETIGRVGGGQVPVTYCIYDIANNWSKWALDTLTEVEIDPGTLLRPSLYYVSGNAVPDDRIDLAIVGSDPLLVRIPIREIDEGDTIVAWWKVILPSGDGPLEQSDEMTYNDPESQFYLEAVLSNATALEAAGAKVSVWYVVTNRGLTSKNHRYEVSQRPAMNLPAPVVPSAVGDNLDPFAAARSVEVLVPFNEETRPYLVQGASVKLTIVGKAGDTTRFWTEDFTLGSADVGHDLSFYCPVDELRAVESGTAAFSYEISLRAPTSDGSRGYLLATSRVSDTLTLNIRRAGALPNYPAPLVPDVVDGELDPDLDTTRVLIPLAAQGGPVTGTDVTMFWRGNATDTNSGTVGTGQLAFRINRSVIERDENSYVTVEYTAGGRPSDTTRFWVGRAAINLPAPTVDEAAGEELDPFAAPTGATVRVPAELTADDTVVVHFGTWTSPPTQWVPNLTVTVPPTEIASRLGQRVEVSYSVGDNTSPSLPLHITAIRDGDARLPKPIIPLASGGVLDLKANPGEILTTTVPWPVIAQGQNVWLEIHASDTATPLVLSTASGVTASEVTKGLSKAITRSWLDARPDGAMITPMLWVTFDKSTDKSHAVLFPQTTYTVSHVADFRIDPSEMALTKGSSATRKPTGGRTPYTYRSSKAAVATVDSNGKVTAIKADSAVITVSDSSDPAKTGTYPVVVSEAFYIDPLTMTLQVGGSEIRKPSGGRPPYAFVASPGAIVTVDATGKVTGKNPGTTIVTASDSSVPAARKTYTVIVEDPNVADLDDLRLGKLPPGKTLTTSNGLLSITTISSAVGTAGIAMVGENFAPQLTGRHFFVPPGAIARVDFKRPVKEVRFGSSATSTQDKSLSYTFRNTAGVVVKTMYPLATKEWITYRIASGFIGSITISSSSPHYGLGVDNFSIKAE